MSTSPSTSGQPEAKRQKMTEMQSMRDVPSNEFMQMIEYYDGPMVIVVVGTTEYKLSKRLLCHCSPFFNGAFNSHFIEGETQKLTLDCSTESFEFAVQWMYTGGAILPRTDDDEVTCILDFLQLTGPFTIINDKLTQLVNPRYNLNSQHIEEAMKLPVGTPARQIIVRACVGTYLESLGWSHDRENVREISDFIFQYELDVLDGFAAELFRLFNNTMRKKKNTGNGQCMVRDPATGEKLFY